MCLVSSFLKKLATFVIMQTSGASGFVSKLQIVREKSYCEQPESFVCLLLLMHYNCCAKKIAF